MQPQVDFHRYSTSRHGNDGEPSQLPWSGTSDLKQPSGEREVTQLAEGLSQVR